MWAATHTAYTVPICDMVDEYCMAFKLDRISGPGWQKNVARIWGCRRNLKLLSLFHSVWNSEMVLETAANLEQLIEDEECEQARAAGRHAKNQQREAKQQLAQQKLA